MTKAWAPAEREATSGMTSRLTLHAMGSLHLRSLMRRLTATPNPVLRFIRSDESAFNIVENL